MRCDYMLYLLKLSEDRSDLAENDVYYGKIHLYSMDLLVTEF